MKRNIARLAAVACCGLALGAYGAPATVPATSSEPIASAPSGSRWTTAFAAFDADDSAHPRAPGGVLFVGSSSIRLWSDLEAQFANLPVVINRRVTAPVPELTPDICMLVENTAAGYRAALRRLIADDRFREQLGRNAGCSARAKWHPAITESRYVDIYRDVLGKKQ